MLAKRIIPCLDVEKGRVVKGTKFIELKDAGDPVELASYYNAQGADELAFLDITASSDNRKTILHIVEAVSHEVFIPFTVGGGIRSVDDIRLTLRAGADKTALNTSAVLNPNLLTEAANAFGSQCVVLAVDAKKAGNTWKVYIKGGREETSLDAVEWVKNAVKFGAGEILVTSIDADGTKNGFDIELTRNISDAVSVPVIASGGAGKKEDFFEVFTTGKADAALAASVFHFKEIEIGKLKEYLSDENVSIRN